MSCIITYKGQKYSEEQFKEYFINNKQEFATSIAKNKDVIDSFKRKMEGIDFIFSQSPELASIGSKAQYLQYLSTIFKTSKVKDIVYHGSNEKIEEFDTSKSEVSDVIYFSNDIREATYYSKKQKGGKREFIVNEFKYINFTDSNGKSFYIKKSVKEAEERFKTVDELKKYSISKEEFDNAKSKFGNLNPSILNIKKLYNGIGEDLFFGVGKELKEQGFDGFITNNDEGIDSILAVFKPEQIHILSSKKDIEGFKEFVNNEKRKIGTNENNRTRENESTSTSRENDSNGRDYYLSETFKEASENFIWSSEDGHRYNFGSLSVIQGLAERTGNLQKMVERRKERLDWDGNEIEVRSNNTNIQRYSNFSFGEIWEKMGEPGVDLEANIISSSFVVQRALQESNKFYSGLRENIKKEFNISIIGEISLDIDSPPLWVNTNHIAVNLYKIDLFAKKHKNYADFIEEIDKGIEEEIIHIAINNLTTDVELLQVFDEMTEDQKQDVKKVYKKKFDYRNKEDQILMVHEFIRMIIQNKYTGQITESSNPTLFNIINRLLTKVKEWLGTEAIKTNEILNRFDNLVNIKEKNNTYFSITPEVDFNLKATQILSSQKANQVFEKGKKAGWTLDKILTELQIPKEQKELILNSGKTKLNDILIDLVSNYSYTIEINTAKEPTVSKNIDYETDGAFDENGDFQSENTTFMVNGFFYEKDKFKHIPFGYGKIKSEDGFIDNNEWESISEREYEEALDTFKKKEGNAKPTQYYSNLTVPGGTNYTENEVSTPLITPNIKGHAQFATDKGIGWFRSDEEYITSKDYPNSFNDENGKWFKEDNIWKYLDSDGSLHERGDLDDTDIYAIYDNQYGVKGYIQKGTNTKTRRILEVQSDWGQKQRKSSEPDINIKYDVQQIINDLQKSGDLKIDCN